MNTKSLLTRMGVPVLSLGLLGGAGATMATSASASTMATVNQSCHSTHFSASGDGAAAGWSAGDCSPIDLTLGAPSSSTFALAELTSASGKALPAQEPVFSTDHYAAGSPRFYITLSNGDSLWGYPSNAGLSTGGSTMAWAINNGNTYVPWSQVLTQESGASAQRVYVIADGDQAPGVTDIISGLQFNGVSYTG
jgi:hypothetical protein